MSNRKLDVEQFHQVFESKYMNVYDLQYAPGKHYYNASRRDKNHLMAGKTEEEFKKALPDAVSCAVVLDIKGEEPKLCLTSEYRYPAAQFLLSVPAGLIDPEDENTENPVFETARRELKEETGLDFDESTDEMKLVNPLLFSSPGMTDESNAFVKVVLHRETLPNMTTDGALGSEVFDGIMLLTKEEAKEILLNGTDQDGIYYSVFTWIALTTFVTDLW